MSDIHDNDIKNEEEMQHENCPRLHIIQSTFLNLISSEEQSVCLKLDEFGILRNMQESLNVLFRLQ